MKRLSIVLALLMVLCGCGQNENGMDRFLHLRGQLQGKMCSFRAVITADYGDILHSFTLDCRCDAQGMLNFQVAEPESISGIEGSISPEGSLEFTDVMLGFRLLADDQLSPVAAPWVLTRALRGGFVQSAGADGNYLRVRVQDSYEEDAFTADIWLDEENLPVRADIFWKNRRILTVDVEEFRIE